MVIPDRLYKYQSYSSYALEGIIRGRIWVSNPAAFNDPYDGKFSIDLNYTIEELKDLLPKLNKLNAEALAYPYSPSDSPFFPDTVGYTIYWEHIDETDEELHLHSSRGYVKQMLENMGKAGIYSLTEMNADLLMWAHYADSHRGFVIGYDSTTPIEHYRESPLLLPVHYSDEYPQYSIHDFLQGKMKIIERMATHKGCQWEHEKEWRIIFPHYDDTRKMPWRVCEIIFGHRMEKTHKSTIHQLISDHYKNVTFLEATPSENDYKLDLKSYTEPAAPVL